jgi:hypothetical protein
MHRFPHTTLALLLAAGSALAGEYRIGDHELLTMPTAWTMEQGQSYFTDYELVFLNYSYGVTDRTHLGLFSLFPITSEAFRSLTVGVKQNVLRGEQLQAALWSTWSPDFGGFTLGSVFSLGRPEHSLHLGASMVLGLEGGMDHEEFVFMVGGRHDLKPRLALLAEYYTSSSMLDDDYSGLVALGMRWRNEQLAVDFGGVRPLSDLGDLLFIPYLKATIQFDARGKTRD